MAKQAKRLTRKQKIAAAKALENAVESIGGFESGDTAGR